MSKKWYTLFASADKRPDEPVEPSPRDPAPNAGQAIADIAASIGPPPPFKAAVGNPTSFAEIYDAAEIHAPPHGFTIMKVAEMLHSEHIRSLPKDVKRSSVLVALEAAAAPLQDVIQDAIKRDRALDTFERVQEKSVNDLEASKSKENQQIQAEMDRIAAEHRARMQANTDQVARQKERFFACPLNNPKTQQKIPDP